MGNIREDSLDDILADSDRWQRLAEPTEHLEGRCGACPWKEVCGGNSRARAAAVNGDLWSSDPRCYLTDEERHQPPDVDLAAESVADHLAVNP